MSFTPVLAPLPRGILASCSAYTAINTAPPEQVTEAYADEPFVHLPPDGTWPTIAATLGSNTVHLQVTVDPTRGGWSPSLPSTTSPRAPPEAPCNA